MLINIHGGKCIGIEAIPVTVEIEIQKGIGIHLVGLADTAVKESLLRTITALQSLGYHIPGKKIIINLAPADLHKSGSGFDLPIAIGIIAASSQRPLNHLGEFVIMGELGLDGTVRDIPGAIIYAELARNTGRRGCILPLKSALEAADFTELEIFGVESIEDAVKVLCADDGRGDLLIWNSPGYALMQSRETGTETSSFVDFADIIGQPGAKRGAEIAAAGGHNVIMIGPPGAGKSSLAKAMAGILPPMTREEALQTTKIYSVAGKGKPGYGLVQERPVRFPHYSASLTSIIGGGGGDSPLPGEVSLANNGILVLDEFGQMPKPVIEALRGPLEDRKVLISRLKCKVEYPSSFILVATANPCPCGYWGEGDKCTCTPSRRMAYMSKLSGPIMDRLDIHLWLHPVNPGDMGAFAGGEPSAMVAERVRKAREIQERRYFSERIHSNAEMDNRMIEKYCPLGPECADVMTKMMGRMNLSMRAYFRIIKVARTIADLEGVERIESRHLIEAAGYRFLDKREKM